MFLFTPHSCIIFSILVFIVSCSFFSISLLRSVWAFVYFSNVVVLSMLLPLLHAFLSLHFFSLNFIIFSWFVLTCDCGFCQGLFHRPFYCFYYLFIFCVTVYLRFFVLYHFFYFVVECVPSLLVVYFILFVTECVLLHSVSIVAVIVLWAV